MKNKISIVTPTLNEKENIETFISKVKEEMAKLDYDYEHIIIDNFSNDGTEQILKRIAKEDNKIINI